MPDRVRNRSGRSASIVLNRFQEVVGEYRGSHATGDRVIAIIEGSWSVVLPSSALLALRRIKAGERVAIVCIDDAVSVRAV